MATYELLVPVYNGNLYPDDVEARRTEEYTAPTIPVTVREEAGLRIVLGTHEPDADSDKPDLLIERQPNAWAIFIHPEGSDPSAYLYILDDGRTYVMGEDCPGAVPAIKSVCDHSEIPGLTQTGTSPAFDEHAPDRRLSSSRLVPRTIRDLGVLGAAIRDGLREIHRVAIQENINPNAMEWILDKHLARLSRPLPKTH